MFSLRIRKLEPSPTMSLDQKVKELQKSGKKVTNLGLGEPDFATPKNISEAGIKAIESGETHYTPVAGIPDLKNAISKYFLKQNGIQYSTEEIIVGVGSKAILYNIFQTLCDPGDEVILSAPTWSTYIEQIKLAEAVPVIIPLSSPFKLTAKEVEKKVTGKTKIILINSPCNPSGAMIDAEELKKLADLACKNNLIVVSDEIYERITYGNRHLSIASLNEEIRNRTITVNGLSKSYAMTGWRIGFAGGPKEIIKGLSSLQGQTTSNTSSIAQAAAIVALEGDQSSVEEMRESFQERRSFLTEEFRKIPGLSFAEPEGAFYFFVSVEKLLSKDLPDSKAWCEALLLKENVAVVPGEAFNYPGYFRLSYAASMDDLKAGVEGIKKFVETL